MTTLRGIGTVAALELRQRIRAGRWQVLLVIWVIVLTLVTLGLRQVSVNASIADVNGLNARTGAVMFGGLSLFLLAVALLVVPALSSQSINGDRDRGVLATLQVTDLGAWEITLGKFCAAWGVAIVFLIVSVPLDVWAMFEGGVGVARFVVVTAVQALLLGVVAAVSLALSAMLARTTTSAVLSYLAVLGLTIGTLIAFGLATTLVQQDITVDEGGGESYTDTITHTDQIWWLLAPNPIVIMVDASPKPPPRHASAAGYDGVFYGSSTTQPGDQSLSEQQVADQAADLGDPLRSVRGTIRDLRRARDSDDEPVGRGGAIWPWGLGFDALLACAGLIVTARRLRTPATTVARGTRVA